MTRTFIAIFEYQAEKVVDPIGGHAGISITPQNFNGIGQGRVPLDDHLQLDVYSFVD
ncbi:hypothetical protein [Devosia sp. LC5]|uniref:hypothetical protein n=1 Tax=Devosia sp. LC5 TaxID=1502724 RepID=UPI000AFECE08|nr:hypothetical protein [Devosia sp. LC5]